MVALLYRPGRGLADVFLRKLGNVEITGQEFVPRNGPLIIVANHVASLADGALLALAIPRLLDFLAKEEAFKFGLACLLKQLRIHPIDRFGKKPSAVRLPLNLLKEDRAVVVFPEGHRSPDQKIKQGLLGVAYLAMISQAKILPVGLINTVRARGLGIFHPSETLNANIGKPYILHAPEKMTKIDRRETLQRWLDEIMYSIAALLPENMQGLYQISSRDKDLVENITTAS